MATQVQSLQHRKINMSEGEMGAFARASLEAIAFLHSLGRIHRDIKSDNILVNTRGEVKVADFGFCVQLTQEKVPHFATLHRAHVASPS